MRVLKLFIISAIIIFIVLLAISLLLPSHVRISRAINIAAPVEKINPHIADLGKWHEWNALLADTSVKTGSVKPQHINTNRFDIYLESAKPDSISTRWVQPNGKQFTGSFSCIPGGGTTIVQWYFDFHLRWYPWEKFASIIYDEQMGPGMEKSLTQLKSLVETSQ
ncbi:MAG TPA: SRPBCC family protein [Chitinophagaceae bacterium]